MYELKLNNEGNKEYFGFTLKEGYWYGECQETGEKIATSGWVRGNSVAIYFLKDGNWKMSWIDIEADFHLENLPEMNFSEKKPFSEWLEMEKGITEEEFDENYSEVMAAELEREYDYYFYNGLPRFVQLQLEK